MRVGVDIDDTLTETQKYVITLKQKEYPELDPESLLPDDLFKKFITKYDDDIHRHVELKPHAREALEWMHENNHEIYIITARGNYSKNSKKDTKEYFKKHNLPYNRMFFNVTKKGEIAFNNGIDIFIDDKESMCEEMQEHKIHAIKLKKEYQGSSAFKVFYNWDEVITYLKLYNPPLKIGIDIDNTITNTQEMCSIICKNNNLNYEEMDKETRYNFLREYAALIHNSASLKDNVREILESWHEAGIKIFIVTSRGKAYPKEKDDTITYLNEKHIPYDKIIFTDDFNKASICYKYNINIMIDDKKDIIESLSKYNIEGILFGDKLDEIKSYDNWLDIANYIKEK